MTGESSGSTRALYELVVENVRSGTTPGERLDPPVRYGIQNRETFIGRSPGCTVRLDDMFVSRRHARLILRDLELHLEDLDSTNQSRVNGAPVPTRVRIHAGDVLLFGGARCRIESSGGDMAVHRPAPALPDTPTGAGGDRAEAATAGAATPPTRGPEETVERDAAPWPSGTLPTPHVAGPLPGEPGRTRRRVLLAILGALAVVTAAALFLR